LRLLRGLGLRLFASLSISFHSSSNPSPVTAETGSTESANTDSSCPIARIRSPRASLSIFVATTAVWATVRFSQAHAFRSLSVQENVEVAALGVGTTAREARRRAAALPGAVWANPFENTANRDAHERTTGQEILEQTGGNLDAFVTAAGTGGTIAGVARALKMRDPRVRIVLADPYGSALFNYVKSGELRAEGDSNAEGIGIKRITENFKDAPVDDALQVDDQAMVEMAHWLLAHEELLDAVTGWILHGDVRMEAASPFDITVHLIERVGGECSLQVVLAHRQQLVSR